MSKTNAVKWCCPKCGLRDRIPVNEFPVGCCTDELYEFPIGVTDQNPPPPPPGDQLKTLFKRVSVKPTLACKCEAIRHMMNRLGVGGCREQKEKLLAMLREGYDEAALTTKAQAGALAMWHGLPLSLEGMLDLAIDSADASVAL